MLAVAACLFYVFVYTLWLKRSSRHNIVIGGAAGAVPVLIGWSSVTGGLDWPPLILFGVIFYWTPPHFWALAIRYRDDYASVDVPMLPAVVSTRETAIRIVLYTLALWALTIVFAPVAGMGGLYLGSALGARRGVHLDGSPSGLDPGRCGSQPGDAAVRLVDHLHHAAVRGHGARPTPAVGDLTVTATETTETTETTEAAETAGAAETATSASPPSPPRPAPTGLAAVLSNGDHKTTGRLFIGFAFLFLVVSGVAGGLLGLERVDAESLQVLSEDNLVATFTLHDVTGVFLFLLPLILGLALYLTPLQVGTSTVAFPRAATAGFWTWLLGGALLLTSYAIDGGPGGTDRDGVLLWLAAFGIVVVALGLVTLCAVATVLTLRCEGMRLDRVPMFSWSVVAGGTIWLLSLPVLLGGIILLWLDVRYGVALMTGQGGIYTHLAWAFLPPQIFAYVVPTLGIAAEVVPVFARSPLARRETLMGLIGAAAALGFGAWTFILPEATELPEQALFIGVSVALLLVLLGLTGGVLDAMRRGSFSLAPPVLGGVLGLLLVLGGAAAGAFGVLPFNDLLATTWFSGVGHLVLGGASVILLGGVYYWAPKIWGRTAAAGSGRLAVVATAAGIALLALPDLITGVQGQDARLPAEQEVESSWELLNSVSLAGGALLILAVLMVLVGLASALARRDADPADDDPWEGHTLEWAVPSPPPIGNFSEAPTVTSATPLLDGRPAEVTSETAG